MATIGGRELMRVIAPEIGDISLGDMAKRTCDGDCMDSTTGGNYDFDNVAEEMHKLIDKNAYEEARRVAPELFSSKP